MSARIVSVALGDQSYEIEVDPGNLDRVGPFLASFSPISLAVVLTDRHVQDLGYAQRVAESISGSGIDVNVLSVPAGEAGKSIETAWTLWNTLLEDEVDRKAVLVAVGGGVIGDLGGFVAATYARGIRFFQVPTTLLAQVDSSVGGKVGIDLPGAKNMVGAFHQPLGVSIDPEVLKTLPEDQYRSGLGETVKYGLSLDVELLRFLEENVDRINRRDPETMRSIVADCCRIKADIVAEDPLETKGRRLLLNYGHTFAHTFEILTEFRLPHGLAVAVGSAFAARLALRLRLIDRELLQRHENLLGVLRLPTRLDEPLDGTRVVELMKRDKKTEFGRLRFILPAGPGSCRVVEDVTPETILELFS